MPNTARALFVALVAIVSALAVAGLPAGLAANPQIERASVATGGVEAHGPSLTANVSADGRYVVFASDAPDLVPNNSANRDIFLHDRATGMTELISVALDGGQPNGPSLFPSVSADGRFVAFESQADDLVPADENHYADIFVRDRQLGATRRVNLAPDGSEANDDSLAPWISANGRYVTFTAQATNFVPNDNNHSRDVFLSDLTTGTISLISVATDGTQANFDSGGLGAGPAQVSPDGHYVVFGSFASTLVPNDNNNADDIFVRDRDGNTTERVSVSTDATEANGHSMYGSISADGRYVVYFALADNLVPSDNNEAADVFLRDRQTGATTRLSGGTGASEANGPSRFPAISSDGKHVAYQSDASNLVPDDGNSRTDIFLYELQSTGTQRISVPTAGGEAHDNSTFAAIDGDGSVVVFQSLGSDLVPGDANSVGDVFAWGKPIAPVPTATRTPTAQPSSTPMPTPAGQAGDVNGDGRVNSIDAALILQFTAGLVLSLPASADANGDGRTNSIDAALVLQFGAGLISRLPP